jgi:uncharacterized membrane protein YfcA
VAGLGGGFLIVPLLRLVFGVSPEFATAASLLFVFANTMAASLTFLRRGVVDVRRGLIITAAAIPTSLLGAWVIKLLSASDFDFVYGAFLIAVGIMIFVRRNAEPKPREMSPRNQLLSEIGTGLFVGFISSFFGIGGGIVLVPLMLVLFRHAVHAVAATSAFVVMLTSPTGVAAHAIYGHFEILLALPLAIGGFIGGSIGARMAKRLHARQLSTVMAGMIFLAAIALVLKHALPAHAADAVNVLSRDAGIVTYKLPESSPISLAGRTTVTDSVIATTAVESLARLQLRDSSEIRIGDRTTVRVGDLAAAADATPGATIYMERGAVRFAIKHPAGGKANYRFVTPTSTLGVRGTVGYFIVGPAGEQIYCVKCEAGDVSVETAGKTVEVRSGQTLNIGVQNGYVTHSEIVPNRTINNPAVDQFLGGVSPFGQPAANGSDFTQSGSGIAKY